MPNRILRDGILDSKRVSELSPAAELFYRKLLSLVDDYGRYESDSDLLRGKLYLRRPSVTVQDVEEFLSECALGPNPLVVLYTADSKEYLQVVNFQQQERTKKYPDPPDSILLFLASKCAQTISSRARTNTNTNTNTPSNTTPTPKEKSSAENFPDQDPEILARTKARELHQRHPVLCSVQMAEGAAIAEMKKYIGQDPQRAVDAWGRTHAQHVEEWETQKAANPRVYIPQLHVWFRDEMYLQTKIRGQPQLVRKGDELREELKRLEEGA
jgi:hypothetical protein